MNEAVFYWVCELGLLAMGIIYTYTMPRREFFVRRLAGCIGVYLLLCGCANLFYIKELQLGYQIGARMFGLCMIFFFMHFCWKITWSLAAYQTIWAFMAWQLIFELWLEIYYWELSNGNETFVSGWLGLFLVFLLGNLLIAVTLAKWMMEGFVSAIGPRQLGSALLIFGIFEIISLMPGNQAMDIGQWKVLHLTQLLLAVVLYLQNELFKKSAMRQELAVMNLLLKKEQEQYQLSRENIALINQKCHDLKHQIRAIRNASQEDMDGYLAEMEDSIRIYEAIVKTGNEVLDTILTEKSLYCKERGIVVSCVADGSQMDFIHTVDLYAILGNALDNAIEAVEQFKHTEKRQIDVLIYRQQNFLVMNIINPIKGNLVYEEDLPVSTKGDSRFHGFGLRSMKYLVKKYDGCLSISEEDGCFSLKILIPIPT